MKHDLNELFDVASNICFGRLITQQEITKSTSDLSDIWFGSGCTDFKIYGDVRYTQDMLGCWRKHSARSTFDLISYLNERGIQPKTFFDFHGGLGLSAIQLSKAFPLSTVITHSIVEEHRRVAQALANHFKFNNIVVSDKTQVADVCLAQETFEHFPDPFDELMNLLSDVRPSFILNNSSFTIDAPGHFRQYVKNGVVFPTRRMTAIAFNKQLKSSGFKFWWKIENLSRPFNGTPRIWVKQ